ncbi:MAG: hypothetical protein SVR08_17950, partial [Spirochaetota bacterium]|nr:hypothetical protein [Spirochaetota bacterium]
KIYFYNLDFAQEISESLDIAEKQYKDALPYWTEIKNYAQSASRIKLTTDLGFIESERYSIITGEVNYGKIIKDHLNRIEKKRQILKQGLASLN